MAAPYNNSFVDIGILRQWNQGIELDKTLHLVPIVSPKNGSTKGCRIISATQL